MGALGGKSALGFAAVALLLTAVWTATTLSAPPPGQGSDAEVAGALAEEAAEGDGLGAAQARSGVVGGWTRRRGGGAVAGDPEGGESGDDDAPGARLVLPGALPRLRDPRAEAEARFAREQQALYEAARVEALAIGESMARDLEAFADDLSGLPRAEQRRHARAIEHHFDWRQADRLAELRAQLPVVERARLQSEIYERIKPIVWRLDALAAED